VTYVTDSILDGSVVYGIVHSCDTTGRLAVRHSFCASLLQFPLHVASSSFSDQYLCLGVNQT